MVKAAGRRAVVAHLQRHHGFSQRRACALVGVGRMTLRRKRLRPERDRALRDELKGLAEQYPRYGYLMLHGMLKAKRLVQNRKRTYRLYTELGLQVRTKRRRKLQRPRVPLPVPSRANERWSLDFVHDQLGDGRRFRVLNVVDDFSRACVGQVVDTSISGVRVARELDRMVEQRGRPRTIVLDNGPELTGKAMFFWARERGVKLHFIQPGKPTQNAFVESFNGRFRDACLNLHWFTDLNDARRTSDNWRAHYNAVRPQNALGYRPPLAYEAEAA